MTVNDVRATQSDQEDLDDDRPLIPENTETLQLARLIQSDSSNNEPMTPVSKESVHKSRSKQRSPKKYQRRSVKRIAAEFQVELTPEKKKLSRGILEETQKNEKLSKQLEKLTAENKLLKAQLENQCLCKKSGLLSRWSAAYMRNKDVSERQRTWSLDDKLFALHLYRNGKKVYEILHKTDPCCLPSARTVLRLSQTIPLAVGINPSFFNALGKVTLQMDLKDLLSCLSLDELGIKPLLVYDPYTDRIYGFVDYGDGDVGLGEDKIANKALVMMIQGLGRHWKQPLAVYFTDGKADGTRLAGLIGRMIDELKKIRIVVKAVVADQASPNCRAMDILRGINADDMDKKNKQLTITYFWRNGEKTFTFSDSPHLWKRIKENLVGGWKNWYKSTVPKPSLVDYPGNKIKMGELVGSYSDVVLLHELTKNNGCPVLLDAMVYPDTFDAMRVMYATKLMSRTVAGLMRGVEYKAAQKARDDMKKKNKQGQEENVEEIDTPAVLELLNDFCDITNGPSSREEDNPLGRCHVTATSHHHEKWPEMIEIFEKTHFIRPNGAKSTPPTIGNSIQTMRAMSDLWWDIYNNHGITELNLRRVQQDVLESLFADVRYSAGANDNPTAIDALRSVKCLILSRFSCPVSNSANCENDTPSPHLLQQRDWINCCKKTKEMNNILLNENSSQDIPSSSKDITTTTTTNNNNNNNNTTINDSTNGNNTQTINDCTNGNNTQTINDNRSTPDNHGLNEQQNLQHNTIHIPDYDSENDEIIDFLYSMADMMPSVVTGQLMKNLKLDSNCEECRSCFIEPEAAGKNYLFEPTRSLKSFIITTEKIFQTEIVQARQLNREGISVYSATKFFAGIKNLDWIKCSSSDHQDGIRKRICHIMACILIRRQVAILNMKTKSRVQKSKNASKVAQMADPNDKKKQ